MRYNIFHGVFEIGGVREAFLKTKNNTIFVQLIYSKNNTLEVTFLYTKSHILCITLFDAKNDAHCVTFLYVNLCNGI